MSELTADKVFISYSWTTPEHEEWVLDLAKRLISDGVEVVLDKWDSVEGQNLNAFMEKSVTDSTIQKVLVICDELYTKKADGYEGGVGTETVIISKEVYKDAAQTKFIPIIAEKGTEGQVYMPVYFGTSKYIDLSSDEVYEENYERLLRNLYGKPEHKKPKLGKAPSYLLKDEKEESLRSHFALRTFQNRSEKKPNNINTYFFDFIEVFLEDFESFAFSPETKDKIAERVYDIYSEMIDLRDSFVKFIEYYIREADEVAAMNIIDFLESIYPHMTKRPNNKSTVFEAQFEHMKLFVHEIILYTAALLIKHKKYNQLKEIVSNHYILSDGVSREREGSIALFRTYPQILEDVQPHANGQKFISYTGQLLKQRANIQRIPFESLVEADLLITLIDLAHPNKKQYSNWFPATIPYLPHRQLDFVKKLKSKNYYESVKGMYGVSTIEEMKALLTDFANKINSSSRMGFTSLYFDSDELEEIAKY